ncbi:MAG: acyltransferase family protein [Tepidisphaeraceae bacterium]
MKHSAEEPGGAEPGRFVSVDALRGFDMFWIIGGDHLVRSLQKVHDSPLTRELAAQMEHCDWAGFRFYDLVFPLFVWIVGVAIPLSLPRLIERQGTAAAVRRVAIRSVVLFLLGVLYMGGVANGFENVYLAGVLQRIAVAYFFAGLLFCFLKPRTLAIVAGALLIGYWALLTFVPVPGVGPASYEQGRNLAHYIDQRWLPGRKFEGTLLSTMPAVANCLLGIFAGLLLKDGRRSELRKVAILLVAGVLSLAAGALWAIQFPVIKLLWTSTYVLVACGISAILLAIFHLFTDVPGWRGWAKPFVWIGMNAITIYLVTNIVNFRNLADRFVGGDVAVALGRHAELVRSGVVLGLALALVWYLHRRRVFLRL